MVAESSGMGAVSVHRWYLHAQIESGQRGGATTEKLADIREFKAKIRRLGDDDVPSGGT